MLKTKQKIKKVIEELEEMLRDEQRHVESKITSGAPQSFRDDMNGCARGISLSTSMAVRFLRKSLFCKNKNDYITQESKKGVSVVRIFDEKRKTSKTTR